MKHELVKNNIGSIKGEYNVITNPIFDEAFESVCKLYKPNHKIAVFSLCTQTKPFSHSMKWKGIISIFGGIADLIICSSAGIIPIEYEYDYPFYNYDSHSGHEGAEDLSEYSKNKFRNRLEKFLNTFKWDKVVFLLDPYEGASDVVHNLGMNNVKQFPSYQVWDTVNTEDFIGYSLRFCKTLNKRCMQEIERWLQVHLPYKNYSRTMSLLDVITDIYENILKDNTPYTKQYLVELVNSYGQYDKSYVYKVIEGNVAGTPDYRFYIKNNEYFIKVGKMYYKNSGKPLKKLF